jgi:hypothetical protein
VAVSRAIAFLEQQVTAPLSAPKTAMAAKVDRIAKDCATDLAHGGLTRS